jgi:hypothetical protein
MNAFITKQKNSNKIIKFSRWKSKGFGNPYLYLPLHVKQEDDFCKNTIRGTCEG